MFEFYSIGNVLRLYVMAFILFRLIVSAYLAAVQDRPKMYLLLSPISIGRVSREVVHVVVNSSHLAAFVDS